MLHIYIIFNNKNKKKISFLYREKFANFVIFLTTRKKNRYISIRLENCRKIVSSVSNEFSFKVKTNQKLCLKVLFKNVLVTLAFLILIIPICILIKISTSTYYLL